MPQLKTLTIEGYRSIRDQIVIKFPEKAPLVLIGENNAGKSNVIRALDILFGEFHSKYKDTEAHDHHGRDTSVSVVIEGDVSGFKGKVGFNPPQGIIGFKYKSVVGQESPDYCATKEDGMPHAFVTNELRGELTSLIVNAQHDLSYQLSYASKFTLLSKVMKAFHKKLSSNEARVEKLKQLYNDIQGVFNEVDEFKTFKNDMSTISGQILSNMSYKLDIDFSAYDPSNYFKSLRVNPSENGEARSFEELGTGQQQLLALTFAHAYCKSFFCGDLILVLDEPEAHLHPLAQKWLSNKIYEMAADGLQIVITTHSPHFINLMHIDGIYLLRKDGQCTTVVNHNATSLYERCIATGANPKRTKLETVVPFYANHSTAYIMNGFFAKKIILVEGLTEELTLPIYMNKVGLDLCNNGIEVLAVQGKGNLAKWWRLFTLYGIPTFVCFDNDSQNDKEGTHRKDALKAIGIAEESLEYLLTAEDWNLNERYCIFGTDFETTMRKSFVEYVDIEVYEKERLGTASKHIVAREVANTLTVNEQEGWEYMKKLKEFLIELK